MLGAICFSFGGIVSPLVGIGDTLPLHRCGLHRLRPLLMARLRIAPRHTAFAAA